MSFFQNSVISKYQKAIDKQAVAAAYAKFKAHFHNPEIQENIRNSKEEQYQGEFLIDLFVTVLGYTKNPTPGFNITTEYKNVKDSKKADGAILLAKEHAPSPVIAVIELKGTETTDLNKIENQAFGYKNNQPDCVYIITSNFEKLRFYIDNAIEHLEFNLFTLGEKDFELLWLCLSYESIAKGLPKRIKDESISHEDAITKNLYNDYSLFKRELHLNLVALNPQNDALMLFKKSQKLLDRFLFLFFAEDRQLLPPNSAQLILDDWRDLQERDVEIPLYARFKKYFEYLNTGFKGKRYDVFAYNGGLFKPDELLDALKIDDELLYRHTLKLSEYDFDSEVDVNILGHIFENSLNELDEIKAQLEGQEIDKTKTKRKKDGVFYTPKYITKYIVDNTVGKLCTDKKAELQLDEEDYSTDRKHHRKTIQPLFDKLTTYRNWLLQLTICDPACGSGAFLIQALDHLITEHRYIDELQAKLFGDAIVLTDTEKSILENNLFGVDINEESVEIAKLSLWLRTAQPNRKLNDLNNNIKCGNSLIDDPAVAGDRAFNWQKEFPQVFVEKAKKAWHITTATHNSRYSQRMFDNFVKLGDPVWLCAKEEEIITATIADIAKKDNLNITAYNICGDHMHMVLVCDDEELAPIVQKIKSMSARACNIAMGRTIPVATSGTSEHARSSSASEYTLTDDATSGTREHAPSAENAYALEHAPAQEYAIVSERGTTQNHLWTQKFGQKEITTEEQLNNTIKYIQNNRIKHSLPEIPGTSSIIADFCCTVQHAFRTEYKGGFDVVIGNPPYVHLEKMKEESEFLSKMNYKTFDKRGDLYCLFVERGFNILQQNGIISFIMPNKWLQAGYGKLLREYLLTYELNKLINFGDIQIFEGATTYPCIFVSRKAEPKTEFSVSVLGEANKDDFYSNVNQTTEIFRREQFSGETWVISSGIEQKLIERLKDSFKILSDFVGGEAYRGVLTGLTEAFLINEETKKKLVDDDSKADELIKPFLQGRDVQSYVKPKTLSYLILLEKGFTKNKIGASTNEDEAWEWIENNYTSIAAWLKPFADRGKIRTDKGDYWWELRACDYYDKFSEPKIMYQAFQVKPCFVYDTNGTYCNNSLWFLPTANMGLLSILNSKMGWWLIGKYCTQIQNGCQLIWKYFGQIPIPDTNNNLALKADQMLSLNKELEEISGKFQRTIQRKFFPSAGEHAPLQNKLQNWYLLTYKEFITELAKKKVKLSLSEEAEWEAYFLQECAIAQQLKAQIDKTEKEIDKMVYKLYELTEEEIWIVEKEV